MSIEIVPCDKVTEQMLQHVLLEEQQMQRAFRVATPANERRA